MARLWPNFIALMRDYVRGLINGVSLSKAAKRCVSVLDTALRWRCRFLAAAKDL
jgi:hypothetical protein